MGRRGRPGLNIYADGTGDYDGDYITFIAASNGVLNWKDEWGVASYRYAVNDGVLVLTGDNGETLRFYR